MSKKNATPASDPKGNQTNKIIRKRSADEGIQRRFLIYIYVLFIHLELLCV